MKKYVWLVILTLVVGVGIFVYKGTYSLDEDSIMRRNLILMDDGSNLEELFYNYIDMIDDALIPNSSYVMSDILSDNYDFLTVFAINYILKNSDIFYQDIIELDEYTYNNGYKNYSTNKYVDKGIIYMITKGVFDKNNYVIINDYLKVNNDMVPLLLLDENEFKMVIDKVEVKKLDDNYIVNVKYKDNDLVYRYIFIKYDDRIILKNLEI